MVVDDIALRAGQLLAKARTGGVVLGVRTADEALQHIRRALALDPGNTAARENLARLTRGRQP